MGKAEGLAPQTAQPTANRPESKTEHCVQCDEASLIKGRFGGIVYIFFPIISAGSVFGFRVSPWRWGGKGFGLTIYGQSRRAYTPNGEADRKPPKSAVEHCVQCDEASLIKGRFGGIVYIFLFYYFDSNYFRLAVIALAMGVQVLRLDHVWAKPKGLHPKRRSRPKAAEATP